MKSVFKKIITELMKHIKKKKKTICVHELSKKIATVDFHT